MLNTFYFLITAFITNQFILIYLLSYLESESVRQATMTHVSSLLKDLVKWLTLICTRKSKDVLKLLYYL